MLPLGWAARLLVVCEVVEFWLFLAVAISAITCPSGAAEPAGAARARRPGRPGLSPRANQAASTGLPPP